MATAQSAAPVVFRGRPNRIRKAREMQGLSVAELAAAIGVEPRTVRSWEAGFIRREDHRGALERLFGIRADYLCGEAG